MRDLVRGTVQILLLFVAITLLSGGEDSQVAWYDAFIGGGAIGQLMAMLDHRRTR